jgi:hypothetical protein
MIQVGVILIAMAIATFLSGDAAMALFILSLGLHFMCARKGDFNMKITWKSLFTPVEGNEDSGFFEFITRIAANTAFAGGIAVFLSEKLGLL